MNQRDALTILYDATVQLDHQRQVRLASKVVAKRIELLNLRYARLSV